MVDSIAKIEEDYEEYDYEEYKHIENSKWIYISLR
jgi:hypothetical protein